MGKEKNDLKSFKKLRQIAKELKDSGMKCNCDLDNWQPEKSTGHSWVCRIHRAAIAKHWA